jgi:hypothetical protein
VAGPRVASPHGTRTCKGIALSTAWVNGDMESWTDLAVEGIRHNALDLLYAPRIEPLTGVWSPTDRPD